MGERVDGERVYPPGRLAAVVVWLLDRLPEAVRADVLHSYWSPMEISHIKKEADEMWRALNWDEDPDR